MGPFHFCKEGKAFIEFLSLFFFFYSFLFDEEKFKVHHILYIFCVFYLCN